MEAFSGQLLHRDVIGMAYVLTQLFELFRWVCELFGISDNFPLVRCSVIHYCVLCWFTFMAANVAKWCLDYHSNFSPVLMPK